MIITLNQISRSVNYPRTNIYGLSGPERLTYEIRAVTNDVKEAEIIAAGQRIVLVRQGYDFIISDDQDDIGPKGYITEYKYEPSLYPGYPSTVTFSAIFDIIGEDDKIVFEHVDIEGMRIENKSW